MRFNKVFWFFCYSALFILISHLIACATYSPAKRANLTPADILKRNEAVVNSEPCEVHVVALRDRELARNYVGIDPFKSSMIPVFMKIDNYGNDIIKVDLSGSLLLTETAESFQSLPIDEAIEKARRSDAQVVGWTIAFGLVGAFVSGDRIASTNKSLEEDYHNKSFKPTLIKGKSSGEGLIFFYVQSEKQESINTVIIQLLNPISNNTKKVTVKF